MLANQSLFQRPNLYVLTVFDHPQRKNFPGAVLDHFVEGIVEAGHTAEIADLHA